MDTTKSGDLGNKRTLVEEGTQFKGSLSSSCAVVVKGRIEGDVSAPSLQIGSTGTVHGRVKVGSVESSGEISGELDADVVQLSGVVKDKTIVRAKSLEVRLSPPNGKMQVVFGVRTSEEKLAAHAWLERDGKPFLEGSEPDYVVTFRYRNAFDAADDFETPRFTTKLTFRLDERNALFGELYRNLNDEWESTATGIAGGYAFHF